MVLYYLGMNARDIATALGVHPNTIYADLEAFGRHGLASIEQASPMGAPARIAARQTDQARRIAETPPVDLGEPYGHWSLATLARASDSPSHPPGHQPGTLATTAQKRGIHCRHIQRKLICTDPQRSGDFGPDSGHWAASATRRPPAVFRCQTGDGQSLWRTAVHVAQRRLVLGRPQKTRGRFYLFLVYEVTSGKVHWAFLPGKDST